MNSREKYLAKGKRQARPRSLPRIKTHAVPAPTKTHITAAELKRLGEILRETNELHKRENALLNEALKITGENDPCG